jgi:hypothetical protein
MPSILVKEDFSIAVYAGGGTTLIRNLGDKLSDLNPNDFLTAFALVVDTDNHPPSKIAEDYYKGFKLLFPDFPQTVESTGAITGTLPKLGLYILPNNSDSGVLETLLSEFGEVAYPNFMQRAKSYINQFTEHEVKEIGWAPFDREKATIATVVSVLKPGKTNTVSISDDKWVSTSILERFPNLQNLLTRVVLG